MSERLAILNSLRALAALMVCLYHAAFILGDELPDVVRALDWGQEGVYVFFVISGLVMPLALDKMNYRLRDFGNFMVKRIIRLQPPLILSAAVMTFMSYHELQKMEYSFLTFFVGSASLTAPILGIPFVNDIYWTLFVEMQFYLYIALVFPLLISRKPSTRWVFTLLILAFSSISVWVEDTWMKLLLPFHLPVFMMGYFLFLLKTDRIKTKEFLWGIGICTFCCAWLTGYCHNLGYRITGIAVLTTIVIACSERGWSWLSKIGEYSYSLYLFHWLFIGVLAHTMRPYMNGATGSVTLYLMTVFTCVVCTKAFYVVIEKPALSWAKKFANSKALSRQH